MGLALRLGLGLGGGSAPGPSFDYYVDSVSGSDSNDGLTRDTAWASLSKLNAIPIDNGTTFSALVMAGTYGTAADYIAISTDPGGVAKSNVVIDVTFEAGCVIDGTLQTAGACGIAVAGHSANYTNSIHFYGNGCVIQNIPLAGSGNGIGGNNGGWTYYHEFVVDGADDCYSIHGDMRSIAYDCTFRNGNKSGFTFVNSSNGTLVRCLVEGKAAATLGPGAVTDTAVGTFEDCTFVPATSGQALALPRSTVTRCILGTTSLRVNLSGATSGTTALSKCFINVAHDINFAVSYSKCYGLASLRTRNGGSLNMQNCIIAGPASGATANFLYSNFDPGSASPIILNNNVFLNAYTWMSVDATNAAYIAAQAEQFYNNLLTNSKVYDADLVTAGADIQGTLTSNPLCGAANTTAMADYAFGTGSPCIGAGYGGGDVGFGASEVVSVGA